MSFLGFGIFTSKMCCNISAEKLYWCT